MNENMKLTKYAYPKEPTVAQVAALEGRSLPENPYPRMDTY